MKKLVLLLLVSFSASLIAGEKVDRTLEVEADGTVEIYNVRGNIDVVGWSNNQVKVTGSLDELTEKFIFSSESGRTFIKVKLPKHSGYRSRDGSKLKVMVPMGSKVSFSGVATDLKFSKIDGGIDVNSVSGDIDVKQVKNRTYINSVSGKLVLNEVEGMMEVSTVSGDVNANVSCRKANISGVSADLVIKLDEIESANISTVSGDTKISGNLESDGDLKMSSVSGNAFYIVDGTLNARVSMETAPGGDIINEYSEHEPKSSFINSHNLRFTSGDGDGVIRMTTVSGNIGLKTH